MYKIITNTYAKLFIIEVQTEYHYQPNNENFLIFSQ